MYFKALAIQHYNPPAFGVEGSWDATPAYVHHSQTIPSNEQVSFTLFLYSCLVVLYPVT